MPPAPLKMSGPEVPSDAVTVTSTNPAALNLRVTCSTRGHDARRSAAQRHLIAQRISVRIREDRVSKGTFASASLSKFIHPTRRPYRDSSKENAMRELILKMSVSIDGFVGGADGAIRWVFDGDQKAIAWTVDRVWDASLHIMGSRTFQDMAAYWPTSTEVFAPPMNQIPKAVFTKKDRRR